MKTCSSIMHIIVFCAYVAVHNSPVIAFMPNLKMKLLAGAKLNFDSWTHEDITKEAIKQVAMQFMTENLDSYPKEQQEEQLNTDTFKKTSCDFKRYAAEPDQRDDMKDRPEFHFDAEKIYESNAKLIEQAGLIFNTISRSPDNLDTARQLTGWILHTLQDFYSHSNWIEMNNGRDDPYPELGQQFDLMSVASPKTETCKDCSDLLLGRCSALICNQLAFKETLVSSTFLACVSRFGIGPCSAFFDGSLSTVTECFTLQSLDPTQGVISYLTGTLFPSNCTNNLIGSNILTSGYYSGQEGYKSKPSGKCSHGGALDCTRFEHAYGGINKDSAVDYVSPHYYLHTSAKNAAIKASVLFLNRIKSRLEETNQLDSFAKFLGLSTGGTLCFVIDTTGSMADEIDAVRQRTIQITREQSSGKNKPGDYLLVPFNDPTYGPAYRTNDSAQMIKWLSALIADDGDDEPELAYHGLLLAFNNIRPNSICHFFTDASAKDLYLYPQALAKMLTLGAKVISYITSSGLKRRKRFAGREKRVAASIASNYESLTNAGGGSLFVLKKSEIANATASVTVSTLQVKIFKCDNRATSYLFAADGIMSEVILQVSDAFGSLQSVELKSPSGSTFSNFTVVSNISSFKVYNLSTIAPGWWNVTVRTSNLNPLKQFSSTVLARSLIDFQYYFALFSGGVHPGYTPVNGKPLKGTKYHIIIAISGSVNPFTGETQLIQNVTKLLFLSKAGDVIGNVTLNEVKSLEQYEAESVLPSEDFRLGIEGLDSKGFTFRRMDDSLVTTAVVKLSLELSENSTLSLFPGDTVTVNVALYNIGLLTNWYIKVSDTNNFYVGRPSLIVPMATNQSYLLNLTFTANAFTPVGNMSTVTVTAGSSADTSVENYLLFYLTVVSKNFTSDVIPPTCEASVVNTTCSKSQNCADINWSFSFSAQDGESGLLKVAPKGPYTNKTFEMDKFVVGTNALIHGNYTSTCCLPKVNITVFDRYGNKAECQVSAESIAQSKSHKMMLNLNVIYLILMMFTMA